MPYLHYHLRDVLRLLIEVLTPALLVLASWATWKLAARFGIEKNVATDAVLRSYIKEAINWADAWAAKQSEKPTGEQKMAEAVRYVLSLIDKYNLPKMAKEYLELKIEAQLSHDKK